MPTPFLIIDDDHKLNELLTELLETERLKSNPGGLALAETDLVTLAKEVAQAYSDVKSVFSS